MKSKHTPGPWEVVFNEDDNCYEVYKPDRNPGTVYVAKEIFQGNDDGEADALLIAAAPDLLDALQSFLRYFERNYSVPDNYSQYRKAKEAIKKAQP